MLSWFILAAVAAGPKAAPAWTPPEHPDPNAILQEGVADGRAGKNDIALAKFLWFYDNALKYDTSLAGVRNSFALSYWHDLGKGYPPAIEAMTSMRDTDDSTFRKADDKGLVDPFTDFVALNRVLGDEARTVSAFRDLDRERPAAAQRVFHLARPALLRAKEYTLCGKYIRPDFDWDVATHLYHLHSSLPQGSDPKRIDFAQRSFTNAATTLVALLVVNGRKDEADAIAQKARQAWDDPKFLAAIDTALTGAVPEPWP